MFLVECPGGRRTREVLEKIILEHVEQSTTIHTDCWSAYNHIGELGMLVKPSNFYIFFRICVFRVVDFVLQFQLILGYTWRTVNHDKY